MKKNLFLCVVVAIAATMGLKAQVFVGGGISASTSKIKYDYGSTSEDGDKSLSVSLTPKLGYFINPNIAFGIGFGITAIKETSPSSSGDDEVYTSSIVTAAPFARYYLTKGGDFSFFAEGSIGLGVGKSKNDSNYNDYEMDIFMATINLAPAVSYNLSEKFSIEASLGGLNYSSATYKQNGEDGKSTTSGLDLSFGLDNLTFGAIFKL